MASVLSTTVLKFLLFASYLMRIFLCLIPQYGYVHPDEFFQFTEPVVGDLLGIKWLKTWEFTTSQPIRSMTLPFMVTSPILFAEEYLDMKLDGYEILMVPRIIMVTLSFVVDYVIYRVAQMTMGWRWHLPCLIYSTSFLTLSFMSHTFTNCLETLLLSLVILIVVKSVTEKKAKTAGLLGLLLALGLFNRPTFMAFAFIPTLFWVLSDKRAAIPKIVINGTRLLPTFLFTSLMLITFDTMYYRPEITDEINRTMRRGFDAVLKKILDETYLERVASLIVVAPYNFVVYNTNPSNLAKHGLHNYYHHVLVNVPFVFGIVGLFAYFDAWRILTRRKTFRSIPPKTMMFLTFWISLAILSVIAHQEGRFLMPLMMCLTYIYGDRFRTRKKLFFLWLAFNMIMTYFYGFVHQAGVVRSLLDMNKIIHSKGSSPIDLIIARSYLPPLTLLRLDESDHQNSIHDLSVEPDFVNAVRKKLSSVMKKSNGRSVYLAIPSCLSSKLGDIALLSPHKIWFKIVKSYFPHFTYEDLDSSWRILRQAVDSGQIMQGIKSAFSFNIYQVFRDLNA